MVINPFIFGVLSTLFVEMAILIVCGMINGSKRKDNEATKEAD